MVSVPDVLKNDVECILLNKFSGEERVAIHVFPSAVPGIVFHHKEGQPAIENIVTQSGRQFSPLTLFLHGAGAESSVMNFGAGSYTVMQVILKPHALRVLFGVNAMRLKEGEVEINQFSRENLNEQLLNAISDRERVALLESFLIANLKQRQRRDHLVEESLHLIHKCAGMINVKALLEYLHILRLLEARHFRSGNVLLRYGTQ